MVVYVVDDNKDELSCLVESIKEIDNTYDVIPFDKSSYLAIIKPDEQAILIIDIFLGKENGIDVANKIHAINSKIKVILTSGNPKNTFDVYDCKGHIYFLEKPLDKDKLVKALDIAKSYFDDELFKFSFYNREQYVQYSDIILFESTNRIIKIYSKNEIYSFYDKLDIIEKALPSNFKRIGQSYIVNKDYIKQNNSKSVLLEDSKFFKSFSINISKKYRGNLWLN